MPEVYRALSTDNISYSLLMWSTFLLTLTIIVLLTIPISSASKMDSAALSSAIAKFSLKFCNELEKDKSVVSSPISAEILLALLALGATDPAHKELLSAIGVKSDEEIRSSFLSVTSKLKKVKGITLNVANKVFLQTGHELDSGLKNDAVQVFDAGLEPLDFANSEASAKVINDWVESKTNNKIRDLITPDALNSLTRLVLVNAIYFKGKWKHPFKPQNTEDKPFHVNKGTTVNIPMMYTEESFNYGESEKLNAQLLEMPYVGEEASMVIILPKEVDGINDLLQKLSTKVDLMQELTQMFTTKVQVTIPKFKIETEIDLKVLLPKLGIKAIFNEGSSGLTKIMKTTEPIYVSKAVQKAFIEVNEEGAEAAAATGMVVMARCGFMRNFSFVADRPFLYLLTGSGDTLFIGVFNG